jgi:hypothetical protein
MTRLVGLSAVAPAFGGQREPLMPVASPVALLCHGSAR